LRILKSHSKALLKRYTVSDATVLAVAYTAAN
jgi:hypothetical protein